MALERRDTSFEGNAKLKKCCEMAKYSEVKRGGQDNGIRKAQCIPKHKAKVGDASETQYLCVMCSPPARRSIYVFT